MTTTNSQIEIERIQTGLTANYVPNWTVRAALKEAAQNIAYGATKCGQPAEMSWSDGFGIMEDAYTGFEKRHLYIGESEQRGDKDGLGNFGEGWKIFLLVMARQGLQHGVSTVGFDFWGTMEPTPHGPEVLVINVKPNERTLGTVLFAKCDEADFISCSQAFASLVGIPQEHIHEASVIPGRFGEMWINGVRVENGNNLNPLGLHFAYNLKDRTLVNRDRSQVNQQETLRLVRQLIARQPQSFVREYIETAMKAVAENKHVGDDIARGPYFVDRDGEVASLWKQELAFTHYAPVEKLVLSNGDDNDREVKLLGYKTLRVPESWKSELNYIGIPYANDVVKAHPDYDETDTKELPSTDRDNLRTAKRNVKAALGLDSVKELPKIVVVRDYIDAGADYNADAKIVVVYSSILWNRENTTRALLVACMKAKGHDDAPTVWVDMAMRLLGFEV